MVSRFGRWSRRVWAAALLCNATWAVAAEPHDPVTVFYPKGDCTTGVLEVELFNRVVGEWRAHPRHARIMGDTCQTEDAGDLLNELRVRCVDPGNPARASSWLLGVQVYAPGSAPGCVAPQVGITPKRSPRIMLTAPAANRPVTEASRLIPIRGRVLLTHDLVVMVDDSFDAETRASLGPALRQLLERDAAILGPLRIGWLSFGSVQPAEGGSVVLGDEARSLSRSLDAVLAPEPSPHVAGLVEGLDAALAPLSDPDQAGDRRTIVALVNGKRGYPFGGSAGDDPRLRKAILAAVDRVLGAGVGLEFYALGRRERDLAELVDRVRERIERSGHGGGVTAVASTEEIAAVIPELPVLTLRDVVVENLANGVLAESVDWDRAGSFNGQIALDTGRNLLRVRARLSDGQDLVADFERTFDATALRERLLSDERARIEAERRKGRVEVDVEERP